MLPRVGPSSVSTARSADLFGLTAPSTVVDGAGRRSSIKHVIPPSHWRMLHSVLGIETTSALDVIEWLLPFLLVGIVAGVRGRRYRQDRRWHRIAISHGPTHADRIVGKRR
jgi:hypothetical protein